MEVDVEIDVVGGKVGGAVVRALQLINKMGKTIDKTAIRNSGLFFTIRTPCLLLAPAFANPRYFLQLGSGNVSPIPCTFRFKYTYSTTVRLHQRVPGLVAGQSPNRFPGSRALRHFRVP